MTDIASVSVLEDKVPELFSLAGRTSDALLIFWVAFLLFAISADSSKAIASHGDCCSASGAVMVKEQRLGCLNPDRIAGTGFLEEP